MKKQMKPFQDKIRKRLLDAGIYNEKNEELIECAARCMRFIAQMEFELRNENLMLTRIGCNGESYSKQHPHVQSILGYNRVLSFCLAKLGLGNDKSVTEIDTDFSIDDFIEKIE